MLMHLCKWWVWIEPVCGALTFPPLYSLATCSSLLGWRISPRREMRAFWLASVVSACSRRSIVWLDIHVGHGTSYLAALTHITQPLAPERKLKRVDKRCCHFRLGTVWLEDKNTLVIDFSCYKKWTTITFRFASGAMSTGGWFMLVVWLIKMCWELILFF